jgi:6-phosphofructokinase 2
VALTLGEQGALLVTAERFLRATGLPVQVSSAIGAGDGFVAAMVWALNLDASLDQAFHYGVAAASATLLSAGTALCQRADVERLYREVSNRGDGCQLLRSRGASPIIRLGR